MIARLLMLLIRLYQLTLSRLIRAVLGNVCRFEPSCSAYALECLRMHGACRGSLLSVKRLGKCHPFHPGGYDPPPPSRSGKSDRAHHVDCEAHGPILIPGPDPSSSPRER